MCLTICDVTRRVEGFQRLYGEMSYDNSRFSVTTNVEFKSGGRRPVEDDFQRQRLENGWRSFGFLNAHVFSDVQ